LQAHRERRFPPIETLLMFMAQALRRAQHHDAPRHGTAALSHAEMARTALWVDLLVDHLMRLLMAQAALLVEHN
jgi:hypothetical protein